MENIKRIIIYKECGNMKYCLLIVLLILTGCTSNTVTISQDEFNSLLDKKAYYEEYIATTNNEMENLISKEEVDNQKVTIVNEIEELKAKIVELEGSYRFKTGDLYLALNKVDIDYSATYDGEWVVTLRFSDTYNFEHNN